MNEKLKKTYDFKILLFYYSFKNIYKDNKKNYIYIFNAFIFLN